MNEQLLPIIEKYGSLESQEGDLYLPASPHPPVICLLHGGFWRKKYGRDQSAAVAQDLASRGFAVWNLEYRRLGEPGGGWPGTFEDAATGIDHLARLAADGINLDLTRVIVVGHSAGGHLALWAAAHTKEIRIAAVVGEAPVTDLIRAYERRVGGTIVAQFLGGKPAAFPERYQKASPIALLPLGIPQLLLHDIADDRVPIEMTHTYTQAALAAGDQVEFMELVGTGHMDFIDPHSKAHAALCKWLTHKFDSASGS